MTANWLNPPDYMSAIRAGAGLGLQLRQQDLSEAEAERRAQEAADSLRLHYDQLTGLDQRAQQAVAARQQSAAASLALRAEQARMNEAYKQSLAENQATARAIAQGHLDVARQREAREAKRLELAPDKSVQHVGNKIVKVNPDGSIKELYDATGLDPVERIKLSAAYHAKFNPLIAPEDKTDALQVIKDFESKKSKPSNGVTLQDKKTGAKFLYQGDASEVPADEFDVIE